MPVVLSKYKLALLANDSEKTPPTVGVEKALLPASAVFNHFLGECGVRVFAAPQLAAQYQHDFPRCLNGAPFLLPTANTALLRSLNQWFDNQELSPSIQTEVENSALLKTFGASGGGLFFCRLLSRMKLIVNTAPNY